MDDTGADARDASDDDDLLPGWLPTRLMLAIGIGAVLFAGVLFLFQPRFMGGGPPPDGQPPGVLLGFLAGFLGMLFGLVWMIRIFRGPRDEPPPWRYRDR